MIIQGMDDAEILAEIEKIGKEQYFRLDRLEISKFNLLFDQLIRYVNELKSRPGDRRILLRQHYSHPNLQVRLNAAKHTLAVAPDEARAQLQAIEALGRSPQCASAGSCLWAIEVGIFVPS